MTNAAQAIEHLQRVEQHLHMFAVAGFERLLEHEEDLPYLLREYREITDDLIEARQWVEAVCQRVN